MKHFDTPILAGDGQSSRIIPMAVSYGLHRLGTAHQGWKHNG